MGDRREVIVVVAGRTDPDAHAVVTGTGTAFT